MSDLRKQIVLFVVLINSLVSARASSDSMKEQVESVGKEIEDFCRDNPDDVYEVDCKDVINNDWVIERYLVDGDMNNEHAFKKIRDNIKFYKREKLSELTDEYFPSEFYATGYVVRKTQSKQGELVYGFSQRCYKAMGAISEDMYQLGRKYLLYRMYKTRMELDKQARINYLSFARVGLDNLDIRFLTNIIDNVNTKQPNMPGILFALDLPTLVKEIFNLLIGKLSPKIKEQVKLVSIDEFEEWVNLDEIPEYIGGRLKHWNRIPDGVKSGQCLAHLSHIPLKDWIRFRKQNSICIDEGMKEAGSKTMDDFLGHCEHKVEEQKPKKMSKRKRKEEG